MDLKLLFQEIVISYIIIYNHILLQVVKIFIKNVLPYSKFNQNMTNFYGTTSTDFKASFSPNW